MNNNFTLPPAQLLIGPCETTVEHAKKTIKKQLCTNRGCETCVDCMQVDHKQHHAVVWLEPEKNYTLEKLEPIFKNIAFELESGAHFFFIIQKADFLTPACSNSLLKSVEEPPPGYHFFFLTERAQQILPTIRSRCVSYSLYKQGQTQEGNIAHLFLNNISCAPSAFLKILSEQNPSERETQEQLNNLLAHWLLKQKNNLTNQATIKMVALIKIALENPPMPGGSKLFWKNFYLQAQHLQKSNSQEE